MVIEELDSDTRVRILLLLLNSGGNISFREIGRRLNLRSGHVHYHIKKLVEFGVLIKEEFVNGHTYYTPQDLFTENLDETMKLLSVISQKINDPTDEKTAGCITFFLKCYRLTKKEEYLENKKEG